MPFAFGKQSVKTPNVSGTFYEADPQKLSAHIEKFISSAPVNPMDKHVEVLIAPHAGYVYSGGVAGYSYKAVSQQNYKTIVVIAPSHFFGFDGISVWTEGGFKTPLGTVPVDERFSQDLVELNEKFYFKPEVFEREHALEVQLPFIQKTFEGVNIVPIIMGQPKIEDCEALASALNKLVGKRKDVLIVVSTDMSHYHNDKEARDMDHKTLKAVQSLDAKNVWNQCHLGTMEMCGFVPVTTAMLYAKQRGLTHVEVLKYAHSGDVSGDRDRVVGYSAVLFYQNGESVQEAMPARLTDEEALTLDQKRRLVEIARQTIETYITTGKILDIKEADPRLLQKDGAFVTIHNNKKLRGCIGHIIGRGPLYLTVRDMAIASATRDTRFSPVSREELKEIDVEVSVLSQPRRITDISEIEMGKHGVIISQGPRHQGVFLPQVATETGWSKEEFLSQLCFHKAGLPADAWKDPKTKIEIFSADVFTEHDVQQP